MRKKSGPRNPGLRGSDFVGAAAPDEIDSALISLRFFLLSLSAGFIRSRLDRLDTEVVKSGGHQTFVSYQK